MSRRRNVSASRDRAFFCGIGQVFAHLVLRDACGVQHVLQAELFALGFLVGAQRLADRIDQLADRVLDELELADLVLGIDQKIADGFILMAKLRRGREEQILVELDVAFLGRRRRGEGLWRGCGLLGPRTRFCGRET